MRAFSKIFVVVAALAFLACGKSKPGETPAKEKAAQAGKTEAATPAFDEGKMAEKKAEEKAEDKAAKTRAGQDEKTAEPATREAVKAAADAKIPDIVARVNGVNIKSTEYKGELEKITSRGAKIPAERMARIRQNILNRIIEKALIDQEILRQKIEVSKEEIDKAFEEYKKRFRTDEQFQNYLKHGKVTVEQIRERMRAKAALEKLIAKTGNLEVTEEEAKAFYQKNEKFYMEKEGVRASHILVKVEENAPKDKVDAATKKIKEAQAALKKGQDFADVAKKFSEGPSAPKGGDLGFFGRGQMVKAFEEAAFALKPGKVSDPVRTRFGFHLIKVFEKREQRKKPFEEVKDQIMESLRNKKFFKERRALIQKLNESAKIEKFI